MIVVDHLTTMTHFAPTKANPEWSVPERLDTKAAGGLYMYNVFRLYMAPEDILSDRGDEFTFELGQAKIIILKIKEHLSTA